MLIQVDILHKTNAYYIMDYGVRLPGRDRLPLQIIYKVQLNLATLTRPDIRIIMVFRGLKIVTGSRKDHAVEE